MPTMKINGIEVEFDNGQTVLELARKQGIDIPTLCYHPALEAYGACRMCVVEIIAGGRPGLVASCVLPATEGLQVETHSLRVQRARKMIIQLLLGICPDSEVLQKIASSLGVEKAIFSPDESRNCVLCGLCVRACQAMGKSVISFAFRGPERKVGVPFDEQSEFCAGCLACESVCPVKAIKVTEKNQTLIIENWHSSLPLEKCEICGQFYASQRQLQGIKDKFQDQNTNIKLCPDCRRRKAASGLISKI